MSQRILVTYASRAGSTAGVAEAVGRTLNEQGIQVDVLPVQAVKDITPYEAVVVGSAIQNKQWLPEAMQFMQANGSALSEMPFATFTLCMTLAMQGGVKYRPLIEEWLAPVRALAQPVSEGLFAGKLEVGKIPNFTDRMRFRLRVLSGVWPQGDHRDWEAIGEWADGLHAQLFQMN